MKYITSDLHFGHFNIIKHSNRPYTSVYEMDNALITTYNSVVGQDDTTYILGDFCYRSQNDATYYLDQLNGKKIFIIGNHDKQQLQNIKRHPSVILCVDYHEVRREDNKWAVMSHYPMAEWNGAYHGSVMLHGHCHGTKQFPGKIIDVGYDAHKRILALDEAIDMANARPAYEESWKQYETNRNNTIR